MLTSFDGGRLFGQVHGSGAPRVLALHGWRRDHRDFALVLDGEPTPPADSTATSGDQASDPSRDLRSRDDLALPATPLRAVSLDLPGFGATPAPEEVWGALDYAAAVAPVLEVMEAPVVLVGHSFGGRVAVHLAAEHAERVGGVLLSGSPLFRAPEATRRRPPFPLRMAKTLARTGLVSDARLEALRQRHGSPDYRAATGVMRDVLVRSIAEEWDEAYSASLKAIDCPVELVWGALDTAVPVSVAERIASTIPGPTRLEVLPGVGHLTPLVVPGHLRAALDRLVVGEPDTARDR